MKIIKKYLFIINIILCTVQYACLCDERSEAKKITKDFNLCWWGEEKNQSILLNNNRIDCSGSVIVEETVFAVGYNNDFIIAKQHPNKEEEIGNRIFSYDTKDGYLIVNHNDLKYLDKKHLKKKNEKWYYASNGWNPPGYLFPYKKETNYYIIDIRNYYYCTWKDTYTIYKFSNVHDFIHKRNVLGIPKELNFTMLNKELE